MVQEYDVIVIGAGHAGIEAGLDFGETWCEDVNVNNQFR